MSIRIKQHLLTAAAFTLTASVGLGALAQVTVPNLMAKADSISVLNDQNFGDNTYVIPAPGADAAQFRMEMKGYVFGFRIMRSDYVGWFDDTRYAAYADIRTSGLAALLKSMEIWAVTSGRFDTNGLRPDFHVQQNTDKKNRRVEMNYDNAAQRVDVAIVPPLGSQGIPAATPAERFSAHDTVSGIMNMMMMGNQVKGELCTGIVPMFDSKQHYNLRMERVGTDRVKFDGGKDDAIHCLAYYEPVSGFDPEDLPDAEEMGTPVNVYFKYYPEVDLHVPVRFTYKISSIKAVIKVDEIEFISPQ